MADVVKPNVPAQAGGAVPIEGVKKSRWWLWLIIALVVIGAGVGIWLLV